MKATTIIIALVLALQVNLLFAGSESTPAPAANERATISMVSIAPATPVEASFEDVSSEIPVIRNLAPTTPAEADFQDAIDSIKTDFRSLAPVMPMEADFE